MSKLKATWTIDEDIINYLNGLKDKGLVGRSISDYVNDMLADGLKHRRDPIFLLHEVQNKLDVLLKQKYDLLEEIQKISLDGARQERERAQQVLLLENNKHEEEAERLRIIVERLSHSNKWERFVEEASVQFSLNKRFDVKFYDKWTILFYEEGFENFKIFDLYHIFSKNIITISMPIHSAPKGGLIE